MFNICMTMLSVNERRDEISKDADSLGDKTDEVFLL